MKITLANNFNQFKMCGALSDKISMIWAVFNHTLPLLSNRYYTYYFSDYSSIRPFSYFPYYDYSFQLSFVNNHMLCD